MKQIEAVLQPFKLEEVKTALIHAREDGPGASGFGASLGMAYTCMQAVNAIVNLDESRSERL